MSEISHQEIVVLVLGVLGIVGGGLGWAMRSIYASVSLIQRDFLQDHVHRAEFISLTQRIDQIAERQAGVLEGQRDMRDRFLRLEDRLVRHIRGDAENP